MENNRLTFAQDNDIDAVGHEVVGKEGRVNAPGQHSHFRVQLLQLANLLTRHGIIRCDDGEAGNLWLELGDKLEQALVRKALDVLVEDAHFMPALLEERAEEPDTQRVFAVHLLGIVRAWSDQQDSHQRTPSSCWSCRKKRLARARKSSMAARSV